MESNKPSPFKKAERKQAKLKLGISGPSGSGKTFSALKIIKGMMKEGQKIAVLDTEHGSASLYADSEDMPKFDVLELQPPYTVDKYIAAIAAAVTHGYDFLIVDSVSHVWTGEGGLLHEKEQLDARGGNSFANWAKMTPKWNKFVNAILHSDLHMVCTMRAKQEHVLSQNAQGKTEVKKMGLAAQVRDGFEYELTTVFDLDMAHQAAASKDRTNLFDQKLFVPSEETGKSILAWLNTGSQPTKQILSGHSTALSRPTQARTSTEQQTQPISQTNASVPEQKKLPNKMLMAVVAKRSNAGWTVDRVKTVLKNFYNTEAPGDLSQENYDDLVSIVETQTFQEFTALVAQKQAKESSQVQQ